MKLSFACPKAWAALLFLPALAPAQDSGNVPRLPVVSIEATSRVAEESSFPYRRIALAGEFTIRREEPGDFAVWVFLEFSGTADAKDVADPLPWMVSIPAGETATTVRVMAVPDNLTEGIETLVATLSMCPPETQPPILMPCVALNIDPARASATVFLRDDGITRASIQLTQPNEGDRFKAGSTILFEAVAIDLEGYISRLEFLDGEHRIGVSELHFLVAPDPGTPIHHRFEWTGAETGGHELTARAALAHDLSVTSAPVHIVVEAGDNHPPFVFFDQPQPGTVFQAPARIEITAVAGDPDGYVRAVSFFANNQKIGEVLWDPEEQGIPNATAPFSIIWRDPMPGEYELTARAMDNAGAVTVSDPVPIRVVADTGLPVVAVRTVDAIAVEPRVNTDHNTATFRVHREGGLNQPLAVWYTLHGTATNGEDYELLSGLVWIEAGVTSADVVVAPHPDALEEKVETVVLRLEEGPPPETDPVVTPYQLGLRRRAAALILDKPLHLEPGHRLCVPLPDRMIHVCVAATEGQVCGVYASDDLRCWERVGTAVAVEGSVHWIDEEAADCPHRFYRVEAE